MDLTHIPTTPSVLHKSSTTMVSFSYEEMMNIFCYCPITGELSWVITYNKFNQAGMPLKRLDSRGYIIAHYKGKYCSAHRLAWFLYFGAWPINQIDHINGVKTDNRICNLRDVTNALNCQSKFKSDVDCQLRHRGITFNHRTLKFRAKMKLNGKQIHIGTFWLLEDAVEAYNKVKAAYNPDSILHLNKG